MSDADTFLYVWPDGFLYAAPSYVGRRTQRSAAVILVSANDRPIHAAIGADQPGNFHAVVIAPGAKRQITHDHGGIFSINFDPGCIAFQWLVAWLGDRNFAALDAAMAATLRGPVADALRGRLSLSEARQRSEAVVQMLVGDTPRPADIDPRVMAVAVWLRQEMPVTPPLGELASMVGLSPSRLKHLFSEQMRQPMKTYLTWLRMRRGMRLLQSGLSLTRVATEMGYADQAHFNRTFARFFSFTPSFIHRSTHVQVWIHETG